MPGNQLGMPGGEQRDQTKFIVFENFEKMDTQSVRQSLSERALAWDENLQPIAPNNYHTVPGPAQTSLANIDETETISVMFYAALNQVDYFAVFTTAGSGYLINIETGNVNHFAPDGTYSPHPDVTTWQASRLLIADPVAGYGTFDGTLLVGQGGVSPNITVTNGGSGYGTPPPVTISGGSGSGATAHAVVTNGSVTSVVLDNPGTGYQAGDVLTVTFGTSPGSGAAATATMTGFTVTGIGISRAGSFTSPAVGNHALSFSGGGGTGAAGYATVGVVGGNQQVIAVTLTASGGGYTSAPSAVLSTNDITPLFTVFISTESVASVTKTAGGSLYTAPPAATIVPPDGVGSGAALVTTESGGAMATIGLVPSAIVSVQPLTQGNYTAAPGTYALSFSGGGGSSAAGTATLGVDPFSGLTVVTGVILTNGGSGYTSSPTVTVTASVTSQATFLALTASMGSGYDTQANVVIGSGSGATAIAHVWPFINSSIAGYQFTTLAVFQGRVWLGGGPLLTWTGTGASFGNVAYDDFLEADASGSLIISDADLIHAITALRSLNNYLFIMGDQSIKQIGNITLGGTDLDQTLFTILTLSSDQGTIYPKSCISYNRVFMFVNQNGVYGVVGSSVQKISADMDGIFKLVDFTQMPQGALADISAIHNAVFLLKYNDPLGSPRAILIAFDGKKWWVMSAAGEVAIATSASLATGEISLYSSTGSDITQSLADPTVSVPFKLQTSLTHHGNAVQRKKFVRAGVANTTKFTVVVTATIVNGGTGGTPGGVTLTVGGGTGNPATLDGTIDGSGILTGLLGVATAGNYTVFPSNPTGVTGGGLVGATVNLTSSAGMVTMTMETENGSNSYTFNLAMGFTLPSMSVEGSGRYLGQTITGGLAGATLTNTALEYQETSLWT